MNKSVYSAKDLTSVLPSETKEKFQIVNLEKVPSTHIRFHKFGMINFKALTIERAEQLIKRGADWIEPVKAKSQVKTEGEK